MWRREVVRRTMMWTTKMILTRTIMLMRTMILSRTMMGTTKMMLIRTMMLMKTMISTITMTITTTRTSGSMWSREVERRTPAPKQSRQEVEII